MKRERLGGGGEASKPRLTGEQTKRGDVPGICEAQNGITLPFFHLSYRRSVSKLLYSF
jgi:hypothetical protein